MAISTIKQSEEISCSIHYVCYIVDMIFNDAKEIDGALQRLGKRLAYNYSEPIALLICGGSALNILGIATRTTRDVDVLAVVEETSGGIGLNHSRALPEDFLRAVATIAADLALPADWLNTGPKDVIAVYGAPRGITKRWVRREYGPCLTAFFVSRFDQVHFKLLAAADPNSEPRHMEDLANRIKPTEEEIAAAVGWLLDRKTSPWFRANVRRTVEALGYDNICRTIPD